MELCIEVVFLIFVVSELSHTPKLKESRNDVNRKIALAKLSTASVGKFTESLAKEKPAKNVGCKRKVSHMLFKVLLLVSKQLFNLVSIDIWNHCIYILVYRLTIKDLFKRYNAIILLGWNTNIMEIARINTWLKKSSP